MMFPPTRNVDHAIWNAKTGYQRGMKPFDKIFRKTHYTALVRSSSCRPRP